MTNLSLLVLFLFPAFTLSGQIARSIAIAMCLLCAHPKVTKKLAEPGILLFTWFAWAVLCSYQSDNFQLALFGYHKRFEGLVTWILAISFGWLFWRTSTLDRLFLTCKAILAICLLVMIFRPDIYKSLIFGHITIAAFASIVSCMLMAKHPAYIALALPFIYLTMNRSMILALSLGSITYVVINRKYISELFMMKWYPWVFMVIVLALAIFGAYPKLKKIDSSSLGTGFRSQMVIQSIHAFTQRPLTGYGIDTLSKVLHQRNDVNAEHNWNDMGNGHFVRNYFDVDRSHNIFLDILLQTGIIGLIISLFILTRMTYRTFCYPLEINQACLYGVSAVIGFGLMNPFGIPAMFLMCLCILGIEKEEV